MALKYYEANSKIRQPNPKASYYADYDAIIDMGFENAPNIVYDEIEYEQTYGKNDFRFINRVRVDTVLEYNTGIILGDDYKTFIFDSNFKVEPYVGMKFRWKDNYWLVINTNSVVSVPTSAEVRRCNNVLRFFDKLGQKIYEPCILDYTLRFSNNHDTAEIITGKGEQKIWAQRNTRVSILKPNDRFLFGTPEQRVSFRIYGGGIKNYLNGSTMDDNSPSLSEFYVEHYELNPEFDDLKNGFANAYLNEVRVEISNQKTTLNVGEQDVLTTKVYKGTNEIKSASILWKTMNSKVATVKNGVVTATGVGKTTITATIEGTDISTSINVSVVSEPQEVTYELLIEPSIDYVLQGRAQKFFVNLYKNGIKQNDRVYFADISVGVPYNKYEIQVEEDNAFTLVNKGMYMKGPVSIKCSSGEYEMTVNIMLRGLY